MTPIGGQRRKNSGATSRADAEFDRQREENRSKRHSEVAPLEAQQFRPAQRERKTHDEKAERP